MHQLPELSAASWLQVSCGNGSVLIGGNPIDVESGDHVPSALLERPHGLYIGLEGKKEQQLAWLWAFFFFRRSLLTKWPNVFWSPM
jgi:hypothetical protein